MGPIRFPFSLSTFFRNREEEVEKGEEEKGNEEIQVDKIEAKGFVWTIYFTDSTKNDLGAWPG